MVRIVILMAAWLGIWVHHLPARIRAEEAATVALNTILQQADNAIHQQSWNHAENYLKQALTYSPQTTTPYIQKRLQWCYANTSLERRYSDDSVAHQVQTINLNHAEEILSYTLQLSRQNYYQSFDENELLQKSLLQLQAAIENPLIYQQYPVHDQELKDLQQYIRTLRIQLPQWNITHPAWESLARAMREESTKAGLGAAWPVLELAYAFADNLDKYSYMLSPRQYRALRDQLSGEYVGTGLDLVFTNEYPLVFDVVEDSPAQKSGIAPGDLLVEVEGINCHSQSSSHISSLLIGPAGSSVDIVVKRKNQEIRLTLTHEKITAPSVRYVHMLDEQVGFMRVASFDHDTAREMRYGVNSLITQGAKYLVIDLRRNGGGVMTSAIDAVRLFLDEGDIVTVRQQNQKTKYKAGGHFFTSYQLPLALLVDDKTASAAEIFTAALQYHKRAEVIGENTLGKALVQTIYNLNPEHNALCITTAAYSPPGGKELNLIGIEPDICLANDPAEQQYGANRKSKTDQVSVHRETTGGLRYEADLDIGALLKGGVELKQAACQEKRNGPPESVYQACEGEQLNIDYSKNMKDYLSPDNAGIKAALHYLKERRWACHIHISKFKDNNQCGQDKKIYLEQSKINTTLQKASLLESKSELFFAKSRSLILKTGSMREDTLCLGWERCNFAR